MLETIKLQARLQNAIAVICGEDSLDGQSSDGKAVNEIVRTATNQRVSVHAIAGLGELDREAARSFGLASTAQASTLEELEGAPRHSAAASPVHPP